MLLGHVPGHHGKDRSQGRQRNVARKRCRHDHEDQQVDGMKHARNRPLRAGPDIGGGAGNRTGHGMPPNRTEAMLAAPCAISSMSDRWRPPLMPSATTALSSDSIDPSSAMAIAAGSNSTRRAPVTGGSEGKGRLLGTPPKREPIVPISRPRP